MNSFDALGEVIPEIYPNAIFNTELCKLLLPQLKLSYL